MIRVAYNYYKCYTCTYMHNLYFLQYAIYLVRGDTLSFKQVYSYYICRNSIIVENISHTFSFL